MVQDMIQITFLKLSRPPMPGLCLTALINQFVSHEHLCVLYRLIVSQVNGTSNFPSSADRFIALHIVAWDNSHQCTCHIPESKEVMVETLY